MIGAREALCAWAVRSSAETFSRRLEYATSLSWSAPHEAAQRRARPGDQEFDSEDTAVAYGISAAFDYALTPFLKIGAAPRVVFNVAPDDDDGEEMDSETAIDLRLRLLAHFPVAPKLQAYASLTPGYSIIMSSTDGVDSATGFAIGAAAGVSYDVSPAMFINGEVGYQRAFTSTSATVLDQTIDMDLDLSYLHIGVGAGTRF